MTPEEFQKLKDAEKEHLRKLRELKTAVRSLERQQSVNRALSDMTKSSRQVLDENVEAVERLAMEAAESEARLELAMADSEEQAPPEPDVAAMDQELERLRAQKLVAEMKRQIDQGVEEEAAPESPAQPPTRSKSEAEDPFPDRLPEKTIGRMR